MKPVPATFIPAQQELLLPQVFGIMVVVELLTIKHVPTRCLDLLYHIKILKVLKWMTGT